MIPYKPLDCAKVRDPFLVGRQGLCVEGLPLAGEDRSERDEAPAGEAPSFPSLFTPRQYWVLRLVAFPRFDGSRGISSQRNYDI